jgi:hypothetical protein
MNLLSAVFCSDSVDTAKESEEKTEAKDKNGPYIIFIYINYIMYIYKAGPCISQENGA